MLRLNLQTHRECGVAALIKNELCTAAGLSGGQDVFVHVSAVMSSGLGTLNEGQRVSFEVEPDKRGKGPKAVNLQSAG